MAVGAIKSQLIERESLNWGMFQGSITRFGKLRIIQLYNGSDMQYATTWKLQPKDIPNSPERFGSWTLIDGNGTYGSRYIDIDTEGNASLSEQVFRGGFVCAYST